MKPDYLKSSGIPEFLTSTERNRMPLDNSRPPPDRSTSLRKLFLVERKKLFKLLENSSKQRPPSSSSLGSIFNGLRHIPYDPQVDPPRNSCLRCWQSEHTRENCIFATKFIHCVNCGRKNVEVMDCPRCSEAYLRNYDSKTRHLIEDHIKNITNLLCERVIKNKYPFVGIDSDGTAHIPPEESEDEDYYPQPHSYKDEKTYYNFDSYSSVPPSTLPANPMNFVNPTQMAAPTFSPLQLPKGLKIDTSYAQQQQSKFYEAVKTIDYHHVTPATSNFMEPTTQNYQPYYEPKPSLVNFEPTATFSQRSLAYSEDKSHQFSDSGKDKSKRSQHLPHFPSPSPERRFLEKNYDQDFSNSGRSKARRYENEDRRSPEEFHRSKQSSPPRYREYETISKRSTGGTRDEKDVEYNLRSSNDDAYSKSYLAQTYDSPQRRSQPSSTRKSRGDGDKSDFLKHQPVSSRDMGGSKVDRRARNDTELNRTESKRSYQHQREEEPKLLKPMHLTRSREKLLKTAKTQDSGLKSWSDVDKRAANEKFYESNSRKRQHEIEDDKNYARKRQHEYEDSGNYARKSQQENEDGKNYDRKRQHEYEDGGSYARKSQHENMDDRSYAKKSQYENVDDRTYARKSQHENVDGRSYAGKSQHENVDDRTYARKSQHENVDDRSYNKKSQHENVDDRSYNRKFQHENFGERDQDRKRHYECEDDRNYVKKHQHNNEDERNQARKSHHQNEAKKSYQEYEDVGGYAKKSRHENEDIRRYDKSCPHENEEVRYAKKRSHEKVDERNRDKKHHLSQEEQRNYPKKQQYEEYPKERLLSHKSERNDTRNDFKLPGRENSKKSAREVLKPHQQSHGSEISGVKESSRQRHRGYDDEKTSIRHDNDNERNRGNSKRQYDHEIENSSTKQNPKQRQLIHESHKKEVSKHNQNPGQRRQEYENERNVREHSQRNDKKNLREDTNHRQYERANNRITDKEGSRQRYTDDRGTARENLPKQRHPEREKERSNIRDDSKQRQRGDEIKRPFTKESLKRQKTLENEDKRKYVAKTIEKEHSSSSNFKTSRSLQKTRDDRHKSSAKQTSNFKQSRKTPSSSSTRPKRQQKQNKSPSPVADNIVYEEEPEEYGEYESSYPNLESLNVIDEVEGSEKESAEYEELDQSLIPSIKDRLGGFAEDEEQEEDFEDELEDSSVLFLQDRIQRKFGNRLGPLTVSDENEDSGDRRKFRTTARRSRLLSQRGRFRPHRRLGLTRRPITFSNKTIFVRSRGTRGRGRSRTARGRFPRRSSSSFR